MKIAYYFTSILLIILLFSCKEESLTIDEGQYESNFRSINKDIDIILSMGKDNRGFITVETSENQTIEIKKFMFLKKNDTMWLSTEFEDNICKYIIRKDIKDEIVISTPTTNQAKYLFNINKLTAITLYKK